MKSISGALFPLRNVPGWLAFLNKIDPVSYGVDPLRQAVLSGMHLPAYVTSQLGLGMQVFGTTLSVFAELAIIAALGVIFVTWAALSFGKQDMSHMERRTRMEIGPLEYVVLGFGNGQFDSIVASSSPGAWSPRTP